MRGDEGGGRRGSLDAEGGVDTLVIERLQKNQGQYVEDTREEHLHRELLVEGDDNSKAPGVLVSGTWYFSNFFFIVFTTFYVVLPLSTLFSQFHSSRKDNTRAIDHKT